jgi:hypothetical protein
VLLWDIVWGVSEQSEVRLMAMSGISLGVRRIGETFGEFQGGTCGVKEPLPDLGLSLHVLGYHLGRVCGRDHCRKSEIEDVGHVADKAIASTLVREGLGGVTELCAMAHLVHGLEHQATN